MNLTINVVERPFGVSIPLSRFPLGPDSPMDHEREQERLTYQLCRVGFALLSFALLVACLTTLSALPLQFGGRGFLLGLQGTTFWTWLDTPVVWGSLMGSYLLWGRWTEPGWQRRTGLLVAMGMVDAVLWLIEHGDALGLRTGEIGHLWLRSHLGQALGWAEFALIASLSCEVMAHLGIEQAEETGKATRSLAATGAIVWMLLFCQMTEWRAWPLHPRRMINSLDTVLLNLGSQMIWTITLIQVTALTIAATRQCASVVAEMDREDGDHDLLRSASERGGSDFDGFDHPSNGGARHDQASR
ncbi:MAG: hypothetical protein NVSMB9_02120 [Isosphaeraceae bacterium]